MEKCGLVSLAVRKREKMPCIGISSLSNPIAKSLFPPNPSIDCHNVRIREKFEVKSTRTEHYRKSTIPHI